MKIDKDIYERVKKATMTDFEAQYTKDPDDDFVWILNDYTIDSMLEELLMEIDRIEEEYEDYKEYVHDNYKPIDNYELYGISEKDFH